MSKLQLAGRWTRYSHQQPYDDDAREANGRIPDGGTASQPGKVPTGLDVEAELHLALV